MSDNGLSGLRRQIDEIDDRMHDLLMQRAAITREIGQAKGGGAIIRPGREAQVLRRLLRRHDGPFPRATLAMIWREIFSGATLLQGSLSAAVLADPAAQVDLCALARDHFGSQTPLRPMSSQAQVLRAVSEGACAVGVLPLPDGEENSPWWLSLARKGAEVPRIVARLPFVPLTGGARWQDEALVVSLAPQEETGEDFSFLAVEMSGKMSRSQLRDRLKAVGVEVASLFDHHTSSGEYVLLQCGGHIAEGDPRLGKLIDEAQGMIVQVWALGGYAKPLTEQEIDGTAGGTG